jgi:hypothetical protein
MTTEKRNNLQYGMQHTMSNGKQVTVFDDNKENGLITVSGMGYYVPLPNFIDLQEQNRTLKESLRKEKSRNAFVEVTGKSLAEMRSDALNEMVFELTKSNFETKSLNVSDIQQYADKLLESR